MYVFLFFLGDYYSFKIFLDSSCFFLILQNFPCVKRKRLNRGARYGLEIPVICTFNGREKAIEWIKSKIQEDIKLQQIMQNCC